jgi:hypothetical protein
MRFTTAHRYYGVSAGNNGIVIETERYLIDIYFTGTFRLSTAYIPSDEFSGESFIAWLGWLHIEITGQAVLEA